MSVNDDLLDQALRHAIYSERFGRGLARRIVTLLNEADDDLTDQLQRRLAKIAANGDTGPATTRRLTELLEAIRSINDRVYKRVGNALEGELIDLAAFEMENQAATLSRTVPVAITAPAPTAIYLKTLSFGTTHTFTTPAASAMVIGPKQRSPTGKFYSSTHTLARPVEPGLSATPLLSPMNQIPGRS